MSEAMSIVGLDRENKKDYKAAYQKSGRGAKNGARGKRTGGEGGRRRHRADLASRQLSILLSRNDDTPGHKHSRQRDETTNPVEQARAQQGGGRRHESASGAGGCRSHRSSVDPV